MHIGSSYRYSTPNNYDTPPAKAATLKSPSKTVLTTDSVNRKYSIINNIGSSKENYGSYIMNDFYTTWPGGTVYPLHSGAFNITWTDGHVSKMKSSETDWNKAYTVGYLYRTRNAGSKWARYPY